MTNEVRSAREAGKVAEEIINRELDRKYEDIADVILAIFAIAAIVAMFMVVL